MSVLGWHCCAIRVAVDIEQALEAKFAALFPHLDERQRRLAMAAEARELGHGGVAVVARAAGVSRVTVSAGVRELDAGEAPLGRTRRAGGGRKNVTETLPGARAALLALVDPDSRGDPQSPLRWTTKSLRNLAGELTRRGHPMSAPSVAVLLRAENFSLQANAKTIEGGAHPDRDAQFSHINTQAAQHIAAGQPVISVDGKKKELIGNYSNPGQQYRPAGEPVQTNVYDFKGELGKVTPYGVYDIAANGPVITTV